MILGHGNEARVESNLFLSLNFVSTTANHIKSTLIKEIWFIKSDFV